MAPTLSILIVSYNTRAMTLACLDSLAEGARGIEHEVIVVDCASTDGSAAAIGAHPATSRLVALDENAGFARGNNIAAAEAKGELLLLLNPDTVVPPGAIARLLAFARRRPEAMIWGGRTTFADGRLNPSSAWNRMTPWRLLCRVTGLTGLFPRSSLLNGEAIGGWDRASEREVDIVSGCFLMLPAPLWRRLGGFDPAFFMYGEEADLCLRARTLGARPAVTPEATIVHHGGASEATREGKLVKLLAAKATLIDRHFAWGTRRLGRWLNALWPLSRWLALAVVGTITMRADLRARAAVWRSVWQRRGEWAAGYRTRPPRTRSAPPPAPAPAEATPA